MATRREPFPQEVAEDLLVRCHRRCCVCHRFCGVKMEIDHIKQAKDGGPSTSENGIPVCFECHAEIHLYNPDHPKGRRFRESELRRHRDQWFQLCEKHPEMFARIAVQPITGTLERLLNELDFNALVAAATSNEQLGCPFETAAFTTAIEDGTIGFLDPDVRRKVQDAYRHAHICNKKLNRLHLVEHSSVRAEAINECKQALSLAGTAVREAKEAINSRLAA